MNNIKSITGIELCSNCHNFVSANMNTTEVRKDNAIIRWDVDLHCSKCGCFLYSYSAYPTKN